MHECFFLVPVRVLDHLNRRDEGNTGRDLDHLNERDEGNTGRDLDHLNERDESNTGRDLDHLNERDEGNTGLEGVAVCKKQPQGQQGRNGHVQAPCATDLVQGTCARWPFLGGGLVNL